MTTQENLRYLLTSRGATLEQIARFEQDIAIVEKVAAAAGTDAATIDEAMFSCVMGNWSEWDAKLASFLAAAQFQRALHTLEHSAGHTQRDLDTLHDGMMRLASDNTE